MLQASPETQCATAEDELLSMSLKATDLSSEQSSVCPTVRTPHGAGLRVELTAFRKANAWVEESALFYALTQTPGTANKAWWDWPAGLRSRCHLAPQTVPAYYSWQH